MHFLRFLSFILIILLVNSVSTLLKKSREKRTLPFPRGSSFGYLVAIAVPLEEIEQNVFLSFNLETNFALPSNNTHYDLINKWNIDEEQNLEYNNVTVITRKRSIYSRKNLYKTIEGHLQNFGFNGTACLLRMICEVSSDTTILKNNGVFGSLFHIFFRPSTSLHENDVNLIYRQAEQIGLKENCFQHYHAYCPTSILDMISQTL